MHDDAVRVLLVEDDEDDYVLTRDLLAEGFGSRFTWTGQARARPGSTG